MPYSSPAQRAAVWASRNRTEKERESTWNETITGGRGLTKRDVHNYYMDPVIQQRLLKALQGRDLLAVMSRSPDEQITRRYRRTNEPIRVHNKDDLDYYSSRRYTEFHPAIGRQTEEVWVDIDPGEGVSLDRIKSVSKDVERNVRSLPHVRDVLLNYSGGRGFHVHALLDKPRATDKMRKNLEHNLKPLVDKEKDLTSKPPGKDEIRLDTSTLHDRGSLRAPYSLNTETGLVAVPVPRKDLDRFLPEIDATPEAVLKKKEFAPGIPAERTVQPIPKTKDRHWTIAVQQHDAKRAGKHFDLRLVDPDTGFAHSWAIPKTRFPGRVDRPVLAIQTPTHTAEYALRFGEGQPKKIPKGYGTGTVKIVEKDPVKILSANPDSVKFEKRNGETYHLFRTKDTTWLLRNTTPDNTKEGAAMSEAFDIGYRLTMEKLAARRASGMSGEPRMNEIQRPMEDAPEGGTVNSLAQMLQELPDLRRKPESGKPVDLGIERRLNRPTAWGESHDMKNDPIQGSSPVFAGRW